MIEAWNPSLGDRLEGALLVTEHEGQKSYRVEGADGRTWSLPRGAEEQLRALNLGDRHPLLIQYQGEGEFRVIPLA